MSSRVGSFVRAGTRPSLGGRSTMWKQHATPLRTLFNARPPPNRFLSGVRSTVIVVGLGLGAYYLSDSRAAAYRYFFVPVLRWTTDAETAHELAIKALKAGITPVDRSRDVVDPALEAEVFGQTLLSPVGLAAGFDKNGEAIDSLFDLGFSYVEVGSITPKPQVGNPKPRFFRLPKDDAAINRYGFNSDGHLKVATRLRLRLHAFLSSNPESWPVNHAFRAGRMLGVNLGKNKTGNEIEDYIEGVQTMGNYADVLIINISSPNTPGLRDMQSEAKLGGLLSAVIKARDGLSTPQKPPICVKIAPDLTELEVVAIAEIVKKSGIDGVIVSNTTITRPASLKSPKALSSEVGGLSGPPVKEPALHTLRTLRRAIGPDFTLIGCGGISSGKDAIEFAKAGASFVQALTAFAYDGPGFPSKLREEIKTELAGRKWKDLVNADYPS
ncbi:Dihydroorotate dehydrogenase-domain-containing protein [Limtongia smithiae]|uniref:Dihydroorotate dehydrogenase-domain-containing protein n=1 Tax=Limtongia smithiae TaxID=1125753 RepID=UPI0034CFE1DE